jgi:hypothetical protein
MSTTLAGVAADTRARAQHLLAEARSAVDLPALAAGDAVLMPSTSLSNTFICQPQQQNMHGRVFGGFLMRCPGHSHSQPDANTIASDANRVRPVLAFTAESASAGLFQSLEILHA